MPVSRFITYPIVTNAQDLMSRGFNYLKNKWTSWTPAEGNLDVGIIELVADQQADVATMATQVPKAIFRTLGQSLFRIPAIEATSAVTSSTWYLTDTLGHTIEAGKQVGIRDSLGNLQPFRVLVDVIVPSGSNVTSAGQVQLIASNSGSAANGIGTVGGNVEPIDTFAWVDHITQTTVTADGLDAESDDTYMNRLAVELSTISPRPILPIDFGILARTVAGVQRATVIDGYNPANGTTNNERMITIYAVDSSGQPVDGTVKTAISAYLESMREMNFIVNTDDATMHEIDVTVHAVVLPGYSASDVAGRLLVAVQEYLNPALWGITPTDDPNNPLTWNNQTTILYLDMVHELSDVAGVKNLSSLTIGLHGGVQTAADLVLTGHVPLPFTNPIDITVVTS